MRNVLVLAAVAASVWVGFGDLAEAAEIGLTVTPAADGADVPVCAPVELPADLARTAAEEIAVTMTPAAGQAVAGQIVRDPNEPVRLWWILPKARAGEAQKWSVALAAREGPAGPLKWKDAPGDHLDLLAGDRPVIRYMYASDTSTKKKAFATYKVYTHVMDGDGAGYLTNGPGGLYPHHRGIFFGYNRTGYDGDRKGDWWHMSGGRMEHRKFLALEAGPVLARMVALIHWNDRQGKPVVIERREQVVFRPPAGTMLLLAFRSLVTAARSDVTLDGDPEHAGMHFRPHNDVNRKATRYVFPDAKVTAGNVAKERDLPWAAECFELKGAKYGVLHMNDPGNPKGTRYSAYRDYGRFGAFVPAKVARGKTVTFRYGIWVGAGELPSREKLQANWQAFAAPAGAAPAE